MQAMVECPRCGFAQPNDKYCASCGVDMEALLAKPDPLWKRTLQNPTLHLSLIGLLVVLVVGWIFYTQSDIVSREVGNLLDLPISSKNAGEPMPPGAESAAPAAATPITEPADAAGEFRANVDGEALADAAGDPGEPATAGSESAAAASTTSELARPGEVKQVEVTFWEVPREQLALITVKAEKDAGPGAYVFKSGDELTKMLRAQSETIGAPRSVNTQATGTELQIETPATAPENFRFSLQLHFTEGLRWDLTLQLPEMGAVAGTSSSAVAPQAVGSSAMLPKDGAVMLVIDADQRNLSAETIKAAGEGPWSVFASPEFRVGMTEWIAVIHLK